MRQPADPVSVSPDNPSIRAEWLADMIARPWAHDFYQAMRTLEARHPEMPRFGTAAKPQDEVVRLGQAPDLSFAPSALHAVVPASGVSKPRIEVRFFGLFGPNGPLPLNLTEYAQERLQHHGDPTFARFADVFHHRLLTLFYRAWAQGQPTANLDRAGDDHFGAFVGSLIGLGKPKPFERLAAPGWKFHAEFHHAGLLSRQVRNADGLAALLSSFLQRPVRVEQFAGAWIKLQTEDRTRIGLGGGTGNRANRSATLGTSAVLGATVWDRQHNFRLHIGPVERAEFDTLLPEGEALSGVIALVEQYVGIEFGWDMRLSLKGSEAGEVTSVVVGETAAPGPCRLGRKSRLGWTSWLGMKGRVDDVVLALKPDAARSALKSGGRARARHTSAPAN